METNYGLDDWEESQTDPWGDDEPEPELAQQLAQACKERDVYQEYIHACQIDCDDEYIDTTHEAAVELYRKNSKLPPVPFGRVAALQAELARTKRWIHDHEKLFAADALRAQVAALKGARDEWKYEADLAAARSSLEDARHCLMLMIEKHRHWVLDLDATPGQKEEMERARALALKPSDAKCDACDDTGIFQEPQDSMHLEHKPVTCPFCASDAKEGT